MFGFRRATDPRRGVYREHQRRYRYATHHGLKPTAAHERAIREVLAQHTFDRPGSGQRVSASAVRAEAVPFLLLAGGKGVEVLAEYLAWRDTGDEHRLGYLRAMLAVAFQKEQRWPRSVLLALGETKLEEVPWFTLLRPRLQAHLRAVQGEVEKRTLRHLQAEAAMAL